MRGNNSGKFNIIVPKCISDFLLISYTNQLALTVIYAIFIPLVIVANVLLIIGIIKAKRKELTTSQIFFILLAISDLFLGVFYLPIQLFLLQTDTIITCVQLQLRAFWLAFPLVFSGNTMLLISIDRFVHVTRKRPPEMLMKGLIIVDVLITFTWAITYMRISDGFNIKTAAKFFISLSIYEGMGLAISVSLNILLLRNVKRQARSSSISKTRIQAKNSSFKKKSYSLTTTIALIVTTLVITYIPSIFVLNIAAYTFLFSSERKKIKNITLAVTWSLVPVQLNAILNSVIYISRNRRIKRYFKRLVRSEDSEGTSDTSYRSGSSLRMVTLSFKRPDSVYENNVNNQDNMK